MELDRDSCYRALAARDSRFDGVFFTGVKTTGIYCRPVCGVRTPRLSSCLFFGCAAAAEASGFRPCLRCRPELAPYAVQQNLAYAIWQRIAAGRMNEGEAGAAEALAAEVGLSSRQMRRVLFEHFGVTPIELAQTQRLLFAKKLLQETQMPMADLAFAAGFRSVRRFNALFLSRYGMPPGSIRRSAESVQANPDVLRLRLAYRPPLAWTEALDFFRQRGIAGVEGADLPGAPGYARTVKLSGRTGWLRVSAIPGREQLQLDVAPSLAPVLMPLVARVRNQFDLDANPSMIAAHLGADSLLAAQMARAPGLRVPGAFDAFELSVRAVLGQQVSVAAASTLAARLVERYGTPADTPWPQLNRHFPAPQALTGHAPAEIGLPLKRAETVRQLALFAAEGGLDMQPGLALDETVRRLKSVPGIGDWTAQYIAMRALRHADAFPAGDLALRKAAGPRDSSARAGSALNETGLAAMALKWKPWRAYATVLLWHSLKDARKQGFNKQ
jgi:AraC family transcriptional regulator of adaptative response / DNA-3-methyladenine glycosylase II